MGGSSFFTKPLSPGYDPLRNAVLGIGDKTSPSPIASAPVPLPGNPITPANPEVIQAEQDYAKDNLLRKSVKKTIFAGDTGGYNPKLGNPGGVPNPVASYKGRG